MLNQPLAKRRSHRLFGGRYLPAVSLVLLLAPRLVSAAPPEGASSPGAPLRADGPLTPALERALAERFAPTLIYHRDEKYFPTSPLFPLQNQIRVDRDAADPTSIAARLGSVDQRRAYYESLLPHEQAALARVFYRAYASRLHHEDVVVIEYWLYYVHNEYRVRGNLFPFWLDSDHPNDLEHIHVIVHRDAEGHYALFEVDASAHTGTMPANRHRFTSEDGPPSTRFIVELGSHANAPDIDGDGIFTPGTDGASGYKLLWGIRDRGITWARYHSGYMDARVGLNAVVFEPAERADVASDRLRYRLVPVSELEESFAELNLSVPERQALFETHRNWFRRLFGSDNGSSGKLLVPPPRRENTGGNGLERFASTERGFLVGTQVNMEKQGAFVGARYAYLLGGTYVPDVTLEVDGVVARHKRFINAQALVSYPIDGSTTVMFGRGLVFDSLNMDRRQWDWIGAVEFPVGHMRVYFATRSWGPITNYAQEFRLSYFFK